MNENYYIHVAQNTIDYTEYLSKHLDNTIAYTEYIAESLSPPPTLLEIRR